MILIFLRPFFRRRYQTTRSNTSTAVNRFCPPPPPPPDTEKKKNASQFRSWKHVARIKKKKKRRRRRRRRRREKLTEPYYWISKDTVERHGGPITPRSFLFVCLFFFCFFFFYVTEAERRCLQCTDFDGLSPVEVHVASPSSRSGVDSGQQGQSGQQRRSPAPVEVHSFLFCFFFSKRNSLLRRWKCRQASEVRPEAAAARYILADVDVFIRSVGDSHLLFHCGSLHDTRSILIFARDIFFF